MEKYMPTLAIMLALLAQGAAVVWIVSGLSHQVNQNASEIVIMRQTTSAHSNAITRIDTNLEYIKDALSVMVARKD